MPSEKTPTTPQQWLQLRRLEAAGCPVFWDGLAEPCVPVRIVHQPPALGTELFPLTQGVGMALRVCITAAVRITIKLISIRFDGATGPVSWLPYSESDHYRFQQCCDGEVRFSRNAVLNHRIQNGITFRPGESVDGYLLLLLGAAPPPSSQSREVILYLYDPLGRRYPFALDIANSQQISGTGDSACRFVSASELEHERKEKAAAEEKWAQARREAEEKRKKKSLADIVDEVIARP